MAGNPYRGFISYAAQQYGVNAGVLDAIARLESSYRPGVVNDWDSNAAAGTPSAGMFQFIEPTFRAFSKDARAANPEAWAGVPNDWKDWRAQALTTAWAIANGKGSHWATYDRAKGYAGKGAPPSRGNIPAGGAAPAAGGAAPMPQPMMPDRGSAIDRAFKGDINKRVRASMKAKWAHHPPPTPVARPAAAAAPAGAAPSASAWAAKDAPPRKKGEADWQYIQRLGRTLFGLENDPGDSQTTGGSHSAGSEHYDGRAVDFGDARNNPAQLKKFMAWAKAHGFDVLWEGDHVHVSMPGSGT